MNNDHPTPQQIDDAYSRLPGAAEDRRTAEAHARVMRESPEASEQYEQDKRAWPKSKPAGSLPTTWSLRTYDVWGNANDGYEVNDTYSKGEIELRIPQTRHNVGTAQEFVSATPSDRQIKRAFGVTCRIDTDGDDLLITVNRQSDGYPIGEMYCTSHSSLSPVRKNRYEVIVGKETL